MDLIAVFGWISTSLLVSRLLQAALIKSGYRVQQFLQDMTPYYDSNNHDGRLTTESKESNGDDDSESSKSEGQDSLQDVSSKVPRKRNLTEKKSKFV